MGTVFVRRAILRRPAALLALPLLAACGQNASREPGAAPVATSTRAPRPTAAPAVATQPTGAIPAFEAEPIGFAAVAPSTTGGKGGPVVTASNLDDLQRYLRLSEPHVIQIAGTITLRGMQNLTGNKTLIGMGADAKIVKGGFNLSGISNVIIRNLTFEESPDDAINMQDGTHHVWVDHNVFAKAFDGLVDVKRQASYVTISWNVFRDHNKVSLVGHDDAFTADKGKLKVTYHHNWFRGESRNPRVRFGEVHVFNNFYDGVSAYGVASTQDAAVVVEGNYFRAVRRPALVGYEESGPGDLVHRDNVFERSGDPQSRGTAFDPAAAYPYEITAAAGIPTLIEAGAGTGKI